MGGPTRSLRTDFLLSKWHTSPLSTAAWAHLGHNSINDTEEVVIGQAQKGLMFLRSILSCWKEKVKFCKNTTRLQYQRQANLKRFLHQVLKTTKT